MRRRLSLIAIVVVGTGCLRDDLVACSFGLCPVDKVCDEIHATCASRAQIDACAQAGDQAACMADGSPGLCDQGVCIAACGDGVRLDAEECDDANFAGNDGCTAQCTLETPTWTEWRNGWPARTTHVAAYDSSRGALVVVGGRDTASFVQQAWERQSSIAPGSESWTMTGATPAIGFSAGAYDVARGRLVLFGGAINGMTDRTWEYDGTTWTSIATPELAPRNAPNVVYDTGRQRVVLFGGFTGTTYFDDTWEWDGTRWTPVASTLRPSPRWYGGMAYDSDRGVIVMHGGGGPNGVLHDTWELASGQWTLKQTGSPASPLQRLSSMMAYLPGRSCVVMFGGQVGSGLYASDTWEYCAGSWSQVPTAVAPPARMYGTLTLDAQRGTLVLAGGTADAITEGALDDVWEYSASGWTPVTPRFAPLPVAGASSAYDAGRNQVVVFGGQQPAGYDGETWIFDGNWRQQFPVQSPAPRVNPAMTYDASRNRVLLFGGSNGMPFDDMWEWDGAEWTPGIKGPPPRAAGRLEFDPERGVSVLFGGGARGVKYVDTWELASGVWTQVLATGAPLVTSGTFDPHRHGIIGITSTGETWLYRDATWTRLAGDAPARLGATVTIDPQRGRIVMLGGMDGSAISDELWELDDTDQWKKVAVEASFTPRLQPTFARRPDAPGLLLFGGVSTSPYLGDTWLFQYR